MIRTGTVVCLLALVICSVAKKDATRIRNSCSQDVLDAVISRYSRLCVFKDDHLLSRVYGRTSNCKAGTGGMWKVDRTLFELTKTKTTATLSKLRTKVENIIGKRWEDVTYEELDIPYVSWFGNQMVMADISGAVPMDAASVVAYIKNQLKSTDDLLASTITSEKEGLLFNCKSKKADVVFVLDASGSVGQPSFTKSLTFLEQVVNSFTIGNKAARVGMVLYSTTAKTIFSLEKYDTKSDIKSAINRVKYTAGSTYTNLGLDMGMDIFKEASERPYKTKQIMILMTDGKSTVNAAALASAKKVHEANVKLFAIGVGSGIDKQELKDIGSSPSCKHVFELVSFDAITDFVTQLQLESCKASSKVNVGELIQGELEASETIDFELEVKEGDLQVDGTFKVEVEAGVGSVTLYGDVDSKPNAASNSIEVTASTDGGAVAYIAVNTDGYARRRRRNTAAKSYMVYLSAVGNEPLNQFRLLSAAPQSLKPSLFALVTCLVVLVTRM